MKGKIMSAVVFKPKANCKDYTDIKNLLNSHLRTLPSSQLGKLDVAAMIKSISNNTRYVGTNNREMWLGKTESQVKTIAKNIDQKENDEIAIKQEYDDETRWDLDSGLMAYLATDFSAGNCDDLASRGLYEALKANLYFVGALVQDRNYDHSFLIFTSQIDEFYYLDIWVPNQRYGVLNNINSGSYDLYSAIVSDTKIDLIKLWNDYPDKPKPSEPSTETPRYNQVGRYRQKEPYYLG